MTIPVIKQVIETFAASTRWVLFFFRGFFRDKSVVKSSCCLAAFGIKAKMCDALPKRVARVNPNF